MAKNNPSRNIDRQIQNAVSQEVAPIKQELELGLAKISMWQGPVPSPDAIEKFDQVYPGAAKLIFEQYRKQSDHRIKMEEKS